MAKDAGYDKNANQAKLAELKLLTGKGFSGIYKNEASALEAANKALQLKRDILLANTALDMDKIIVGRYKIGTSARQVNPRALGTQNNNWSNQTSAPRGGFNAEIAEKTEQNDRIEMVCEYAQQQHENGQSGRGDRDEQPGKFAEVA